MLNANNDGFKKSWLILVVKQIEEMKIYKLHTSFIFIITGLYVLQLKEKCISQIKNINYMKIHKMYYTLFACVNKCIFW